MRTAISTSAVLLLVATTAACINDPPPPPDLQVTSPQRGLIQRDRKSVV